MVLSKIDGSISYPELKGLSRRFKNGGRVV